MISSTKVRDKEFSPQVLEYRWNWGHKHPITASGDSKEKYKSDSHGTQNSPTQNYPTGKRTSTAWDPWQVKLRITTEAGRSPYRLQVMKENNLKNWRFIKWHNCLSIWPQNTVVYTSTGRYNLRTLPQKTAKTNFIQ